MTNMPSHVWANRFYIRGDRHAQLCANSRFCTPKFGSNHYQHRQSYDTIGFCGTIVEGRIGLMALEEQNKTATCSQPLKATTTLHSKSTSSLLPAIKWCRDKGRCQSQSCNQTGASRLLPWCHTLDDRLGRCR